jgi:hypothetical protein
MYEAIFTIMNEHVQVVGQYMVQTKSWLEIEPAWKQVFQRYKIIAAQDGLALEELVSVCYSVVHGGLIRSAASPMQASAACLFCFLSTRPAHDPYVVVSIHSLWLCFRFCVLQMPKYIWVDDPEVSASNIEQAAQDAGYMVSFAAKVLMDSTHCIRRYTRACNERHPLAGG